ncbi:hypothetical protein KSP40_PGU016642 [Platanthera guangdongensis]|uniref:Uncharacterized protein n=1 Tax=Platanthera guangdongensis TaxID=2320717 RepID=A0ABR2M3H6_9ASPA
MTTLVRRTHGHLTPPARSPQTVAAARVFLLVSRDSSRRLLTHDSSRLCWPSKPLPPPALQAAAAASLPPSSALTPKLLGSTLPKHFAKALLQNIVLHDSP